MSKKNISKLSNLKAVMLMKRLEAKLTIKKKTRRKQQSQMIKKKIFLCLRMTVRSQTLAKTLKKQKNRLIKTERLKSSSKIGAQKPLLKTITL